MRISVSGSFDSIARTLGGASMAALALGLAMPAAAQTDPAADQPAADAQEPAPAEDEIVVTGFRRSLEAALNVKRNSVTSVDAIVAEDIAKFPDQNLAESLQRIPGISIQRDGGEGRAITVRGLGSQFTRVRVNGLETIATSHDGASSNRDRAFDFNVFASELFSSIVVHKTAEASLDEGSLGAVVDLNTGNPLAGKAGFTIVGSAQASYNDLSETWGPRFAGLLGWKSPDGTLGASVSAAYQKSETLELGNNSVRWAQAPFDSVDGTPCFWNSTVSGGTRNYTTPQANSGGSYRPDFSSACDQVALAFHPRIPRYGVVRHERERLGLTASVQWAPTDATKISIDGLYSRFKEDREEKWLEVLLRSNERSINISDYTIDSNNNLIAATLNDAWVRTEHFLKQSQTEFYQIGASWDQDIGENFRFTLLGGISKSDADVPVETTFVFDDRDAQGYRYDYSDMNRPVLSFGTSVTDPANFQLAEIRDRPSNVTNKFKTVQLRTEWDAAEGFTVKTGGVYRRFDFDSEAYTRDAVVCGNGGVDRVLGTITCSPSSAFGPSAIYGFPAGNLGELVSLGDAGQPGGTTTEWLIPNLDAAAGFTGLYGRPLAVDAGNTRSVTEEVKGGYLQFDARRDLGGIEMAINAGIRYVNTHQTSTGLSSGVPVTVERSYDDWLPSFNVAIFPAHDLIIRGAIAKVITRPSLGNLTPGGSVDGFNYRISYGNPFLEPYRATAYDAAIEWYFAPQSIASVAFFRKEIQSFPVSETRSGTFASTGLPLSIIPPSSPAAINPEGQLWTINSITNGKGATLNGVELSLQAPFRFLPGFLSNFGGIVNATFVDSKATYNVSGPVEQVCVRTSPTAACTFGPLVPALRESTLFGLSKKAFNATLYYEDSRFSARASVSYRGPYVDANSGTGNVFEGYDAITNVDASVRYKLTDWVELSVEGTNLTDAYRERWTDIDAQRNYEYNHFGRTILIGARFKM
ncbi:MAG: TonB-dependent receptor [Sphingomonas sp.]|uniref:TonB-dependent receptor n=1 Tax=Sphingomonas sp. TaxID=28214 RepID=UPI001AFED98C|nr:TonB-dependent receptor [Sphingomonas sp.]MBO9622287.1 TonB-dependent receptor [Sphingomonas sp.]